MNREKRMHSRLTFGNPVFPRESRFDSIKVIGKKAFFFPEEDVFERSRA